MDFADIVAGGGLCVRPETQDLVARALNDVSTIMFDASLRVFLQADSQRKMWWSAMNDTVIDIEADILAQRCHERMEKKT